ncbi:MAG: M28 family peptidase [Planctomycetes bacterium]|nr:M28 family peptidase [Planctomycetota bacterium]
MTCTGSSRSTNVTRHSLTRSASCAIPLALVAGGLGIAATVQADEIQDLVNQLSEVQYTTYLHDELYTWDGCDRKYGPEHDLARDFIEAEMTAFGLDTTLDPFYYNGSTYYNVVGVLPGQTTPDQIYIVGAHFDSVGNPGADDNASGTAGVLEAARVLSQYQFDSTIVFIAFDREEQGLYGSYYYSLDHENDDIRGMISLDMIAYNPYGYGRALLNGRSASNPIKTALTNALRDYAGITAYDDGPLDASDHAPFEWLGFQACLLIEYDVNSNPYYHRSSDSVDTPNYIDYGYATQMTKGAVAYLAQSAGLITGGGEYTLSDPSPGNAGEINSFITTDGTAALRSYFVYGLSAGQTEVPMCPGMYVDISGVKIGGYAWADGTGRAELQAMVPGAASGLTVLLQAVEPESCSVSNLVQFTFN